MADIVFADDDKNNRYVIATHLRLRGHRVREASSGEEAIALVAASRPTIVLLDIMMPDMDGFEACRRIRALDGVEGLPILALTALEGAAGSPRAADAGITEVVEKPIRMDALHDVINRVVAASAA